MKFIKPTIIILTLSSYITPIKSMQMSLQAGMQQETKARSAEQQEKLNQELWEAFNKEKLKKRDIDAFYAALKQGADVNAKKDIFRHRQPSRNHVRFEGEPIAERSPVIQAAYWGHLEIVRELLNQGADVNARDAYNITALDEAVSWSEGDNRLELVQLLMNAGAHVNSQSSEKVATPLYSAAMSTQPRIVQALLLSDAHFLPHVPAIGMADSIKKLIAARLTTIENEIAPVHVSRPIARIVSEYLLGEAIQQLTRDNVVTIIDKQTKDTSSKSSCTIS